jgi:hypothetical protein
MEDGRSAEAVAEGWRPGERRVSGTGGLKVAVPPGGTSLPVTKGEYESPGDIPLMHGIPLVTGVIPITSSVCTDIRAGYVLSVFATRRPRPFLATGGLDEPLRLENPTTIVGGDRVTHLVYDVSR